MVRHIVHTTEVVDVPVPAKVPTEGRPSAVVPVRETGRIEALGLGSRRLAASPAAGKAGLVAIVLGAARVPHIGAILLGVRVAYVAGRRPLLGRPVARAVDILARPSVPYAGLATPVAGGDFDFPRPLSGRAFLGLIPYCQYRLLLRPFLLFLDHTSKTPFVVLLHLAY